MPGKFWTKNKRGPLKGLIHAAVLAMAALSLAAINTAHADMIGHGGMVRSVAVSPDGTRVMTVGFDYAVKLWDFVEQSEIADLEGHDGPVNAAVFLPDGKRALTVSDDRAAILWDLTTFKALHVLTNHAAKVMAVAVNDQGSIGATGSWDRTIRLWNLQTGEESRVIPLVSNVNALAFIAGNNLLASGGHDGVIRLWDTMRGTLQGELKGHGWGVTQLAATPDGKRLLSTGTDGTVRIWDIATQTEVGQLVGHDGPVFGLAINNSGREAVTVDRFGMLLRWNLENSQPKGSLKVHEKAAWAVAFTPNSRFVVTGGTDETARVWHLETGDRIGTAIDNDTEPKPWLESKHPGARLFRKCARCHAIRADARRRSGPHFEGIIGRKAGAVEGYKYSGALRNVSYRWTRKNIAGLFREGPDVFLPGTKMPMQQILDPAELNALIDYIDEITRTSE